MFQKSKRFLLVVMVIIICFSIGVFAENVYAASVGQTLKNVKIKDSSDNPKWVPGFGKKVLTIFYTDGDRSDVNDPLADAIKAKKYDEAKYDGVGIANLEDTKGPNWLIRRIIRGKEEKYDTTVYTDADYSIRDAWGLGDCNNMAVVIVIGKDKKIKFIKRVTEQSQSRAIISTVLKIIEDEIKKVD